jgi:hypothetical protein
VKMRLESVPEHLVGACLEAVAEVLVEPCSWSNDDVAKVASKALHEPWQPLVRAAVRAASYLHHADAAGSEGAQAARNRRHVPGGDDFASELNGLKRRLLPTPEAHPIFAIMRIRCHLSSPFVV